MLGMQIYDVFFFAVLFFLIGVFLSSASFNISIFIIVCIFMIAALAAFLITKKKIFILFSVFLIFMLFGAIFYTFNLLKFVQSQKFVFDKKIVLSGFISNNSKSGKTQEFKLKVERPFQGDLLISSSLYPEFEYGDMVEVRGIIKKPEKSRFFRERIGGIMSFAEVKLIEKSHPSFKGSLFNFKKKIIKTFKDVLPYEEAVFLSGLTLGSREEFGREFKTAMSRSGTTHLVALSGYNITILINAIMAGLTLIIKKRSALIFTFFVVIGFVFMTGAEASVVRAAIMGGVIAFAPLLGRIYDPRNGIIFVAFLMTLYNPNVLLYDIGFQLSFLALIGIIYLKPALQKLFRLGEEKGFLAWRDNLLTTFSAQLAVAPLLIAQFGGFSIIAFVSNIFILQLIPTTMFLGFLTAGLGLLSYFMAFISGLIVLIPLKVGISLIYFFSRIGVPLSFEINYISIIFYYILVAVLIYKYTKFKPAIL